MEATESSHTEDEQALPTLVEIKAIGPSLLFVIRPVRDDSYVPYRVRNDTTSHLLFYRQIDCESYDWHVLMPGEDKPYTWEEPMRKRRLLAPTPPSRRCRTCSPR